MFVVSVDIHVVADKLDRFIDATLENARNTRKEPGNLRFDVLQDKSEPTHFGLYEVYHSADDLKAHQQTEHYFRWRDTVADWMAKPRQAHKYETLFFGDGP